jgi:hypothetical protein
VQRNDDAATAAAPEYTVMYVAEHTCCTANDSLEEPVILETIVTVVVVVPAATNTYTEIASSPFRLRQLALVLPPPPPHQHHHRH